MSKHTTCPPAAEPVNGRVPCATPDVQDQSSQRCGHAEAQAPKKHLVKFKVSTFVFAVELLKIVRIGIPVVVVLQDPFDPSLIGVHTIDLT
jgi:hypothetical protein